MKTIWIIIAAVVGLFLFWRFFNGQQQGATVVDYTGGGSYPYSSYPYGTGTPVYGPTGGTPVTPVTSPLIPFSNLPKANPVGPEPVIPRIWSTGGPINNVGQE